MKNEYINYLKNIPLFHSLSDQVIVEIASNVTKINLKEGKLLFRKGDPGNSLFIILDGWVKVVIEGINNKEITLAKLGPGEIVGEMAVIDAGPRSADIITLSPVNLLELSQNNFLNVIKEQPSISLGIMQNLSKRLRFSDIYLQKAISWSQNIASGNYGEVINQVQNMQSQISENSDMESKANEFITSFFTMVTVVKSREEKLMQELQQFRIQIDEDKSKKDAEGVIKSEFFNRLLKVSNKNRKPDSDT